MTVEPVLRAELLAGLPSLRAFAFSLVHDRSRADDLVQGTVVRAWANFDRYRRGTSLNAWLFTILRNQARTEYRNRRREVEDPKGAFVAKLKTAPDQQVHLDYEDMRTALAKLPPNQREALLLVAAEGVSYEDAAAILRTTVGTVKSRVCRARQGLALLLHYDDAAEEIGPDQVMKAALQG